MKIITIILARGGSKGIPKKNIIGFAGHPLLSWSIVQAKTSSKIDEVFVSSDDHEILNVASTYGAKLIHRPEELSTDTSASESALLHAIDTIEKEYSVDMVVFLQPTSPLRESKDIDNAVTKFIDKQYDSLFSGSELEDFFIWKDDQGSMSSVNYDFENRKRRQDIASQYVENGSIYVFTPEVLRKYQNRLGGNIGISLMEPWKMHEIDNQDDLELCEFLFQKKIIENGK